MRTLKKAAALVLAIVMVLSTVVIGKTVQASDTSTQSAEYTPIAVGQTQSVFIAEGGQRVCFSFVPEESGVYIFQSSSGGGYCDTYVTLYRVTSEGLERVTNDDEGAGNGHFALTYSYVAGETYIFEARAYGSSFVGEFDVTLIEPPIESITMKPISITEKMNGYWSNQGTEHEYYYYHWYNLMEYTIIMKNGDVVEGEGSSFEYNGQRYSFSWRDIQSSSTPWITGQRYTQTVKVLGYETTVDISITETPVQSIVVQPISIIEKSCGNWNNSGGGTSEQFYQYHWFQKIDFVITMKDGQVITGDNATSFQYNNEWVYLSWNDDQWSNHWTIGNTYTTTVNALGCETTVDVSIIDTPVQSVVIDPITIMENSNGNYDSTETQDKYYYYNWNNAIKNYTITMKDGTVYTGTNGNDGIQYDGEWYYFDQEDDQRINHWTVNNTYTPTVVFMGYKTEVQVSIVETSVQSIVVQPISIMEYSGGNWTTSGPGMSEQFYQYHWFQKMDFVITMKDGQVITGDNATSFRYNNEWVYLSWNDDQWSNHWTIGNTYKPTVNVLGYETTVDVSIVDTPVQSVVVEPISIMEGTNGSWMSPGPGSSEEFFYYNWNNAIRNYTITMKDGTVYTSTTGGSIQYEGEWYYFNLEDDQYDNHWIAGNTYTAKGKIMGYAFETEVTITESPVESVVVEPITMAEHTDGSWNSSGPGGPSVGSDSWYRYHWENKLQYKITMKDGREISGRGMGCNIDGQYYSFSWNDTQYEEHWYAGNTYNVSITCMGKQVNVPISICEMNQTDGYEYLVQDGCAIIIGCSKEDVVLNIPSVIDGYPVIGITDLTYAMDYVQELIIPDSVTMLSGSIFEWNYDLKKLTIGKGISNIYNEMFMGADCLEEIIVSEENPYYCSVDGAVYDKEMKTLVVFPRAKQGAYTVPGTVTNIDCLVNNISYYKVQLDLGNSNTGYAVEDGVIYNSDKTVIYACDKTKTGKYVMPDTVTTINEMAFQGCSFSEVVVSENVSEIVYAAFSYSMELEKVVLPQNLKAIEWGAFSECENLAEADLPSGLETLESQAFSQTGITNVTIPGTVTEVGFRAYYESQVEELTLEEGIEYIGNGVFAGTQLNGVVIPDSVTHVGGYAFADTPLESVTIGAGLEVLSYSIFENTKLTTVTIPENIAEIGQFAFANSTLEEAIIERNDVYIFEGAFYNCPLKEIDLKDGVVAISDYAFYGNQAEGIVIPDSVTDVTYMSFAESKKLLNIDVPDDLESIDGTAFDGTAWWDAQADGVVYLENYLYGYKGKMPEGTEVIVKDGTTLIANYAFNNEHHLKSLTLPSSLKDIGHSALDGCLGLEKVTVAEDNELYYTDEEGTVLYDQYRNEVWKKVENVLGMGDVFYVPYGTSIEDLLADWVWDVVYVDYADGSYGMETCAISADMVSGYDSMKPGYQTATIDFGRLECEMEVYVEMPEIKGIKVSKLPNKTVYDLNQDFKTTGMVVKAFTGNGAEFEIKDYDVDGFDSLEAGKKTITVSYKEFETTFEVEVTGERITFVSDTSPGETSIKVSAPIEAMEEGSELKIDEKPVEEIKETGVVVPEIFEQNSSQIFDIRFEKEEDEEIKEVQPAEGTKVTVSIPVPEGMDGRNSKVYHITDGEPVDMKAVYSDGYMVFDTPHFSYYGLVEENGSSISGLVDYANTVTGDVTLTLLKDSEVCETVTAIDGAYNFTGLSDGTYTVKIEKTGHVAREYEMVVEGESVEQDGQIRLVGDINGDGILNVMDANQIILHVRGVALLSGYEYDCANTDDNDAVNVVDANNAILHIRGQVKLW